MTSEIRELIARQDAGEALSFVFFWGHTPKAPGVVDKACLSNWWPARFVVDKVEYSSAEQYMMAEKARTFSDGDTLAKIMATADPGRVKELGREVKGYVDAAWAKRRFDVMVRGLDAKFGQNPDLGRFLVGTKDAVLVEASPKDTIWGIGLDENQPQAREPRAWKGSNLLGFALMRVRAILAIAHRTRVGVEADVYAKYGLPDNMLAHIEHLRVLWPTAPETLAVYARYDKLVERSLHAAAALCATDPVGRDIVDLFGAEAPREIGRAAHGRSITGLSLIERAGMRFVEVTLEGGVGRGWVTLVPTAGGLRPSRGIGGFVDVVAEGMPGLGALDDVCFVFERVTGQRVLRDKSELRTHGAEPPHVAGDVLRLASVDDRRVHHVEVDVSVPRVVHHD